MGVDKETVPSPSALPGRGADMPGAVADGAGSTALLGCEADGTGGASGQLSMGDTEANPTRVLQARKHAGVAHEARTILNMLLLAGKLSLLPLVCEKKNDSWPICRRQEQYAPTRLVPWRRSMPTPCWPWT